MSALDGLTCSSEYGDPSTSNTCSGRKPGQQLTTAESIVRIADGVPSASDAAPRQDVCATKALDATFQENRNSNAATANNLQFQYFGTVNGVHRSYPGRVWEFGPDGCGAYDPRIRPWYVAGASGAKRVVLVLDRSGSMGQRSVASSRINVALAAAQSVLETLTAADYAQVVSFGTDAASQGTQLLPMTADNVGTLSSYVNSISPGGSTDFDAALRERVGLLANFANAHF